MGSITCGPGGNFDAVLDRIRDDDPSTLDALRSMVVAAVLGLSGVLLLDGNRTWDSLRSEDQLEFEQHLRRFMRADDGNRTRLRRLLAAKF